MQLLLTPMVNANITGHIQGTASVCIHPICVHEEFHILFRIGKILPRGFRSENTVRGFLICDILRRPIIHVLKQYFIFKCGHFEPLLKEMFNFWKPVSIKMRWSFIAMTNDPKSWRDPNSIGNTRGNEPEGMGCALAGAERSKQSAVQR